MNYENFNLNFLLKLIFQNLIFQKIVSMTNIYYNNEAEYFMDLNHLEIS